MRKFLLLLFFVLFLSNIAAAGDEQTITQGLKANEGGTYTVPAGTYTISSQIVMPENTILQGTVSESGELLTKFVLSSSLTLGEQIPVIEAHSGDKILYISFDGNSADRPTVPATGHASGGKKQWGGGYDNFIGFTSCDGIRVAYCNFYNNLGDGLRAVSSKNIEFDHNTATKGGHDVFYAIRSEVVSAHDNYVQPRVNSAFRFMDVNQGQIYNNTINYVREYDGTSYDAGPAIQIQHDSGTMKGIEVCGNTIYDSWGPAFWIVGKTSGGEEAYIHHNAVYNAGGNHGIFWVGGVIASGYDGLKIEDNVFDTPYLGAINFYAVQSGWATSATANLDKNIFVDAIPGTYSNTGGYGVYNSISAQLVSSSENCYYDNKAGNTYGCSVSSSDVFNDPRTSGTPSDWTWNGKEWTCPGVAPSKLGSAGNVYSGLANISDEDLKKFEFTDLFNTELSESGYVSQESLSVKNPGWEEEGQYTKAYIYLAGYEGQIYIKNTSYIPKNPSECAKILTGTENTASNPAEQETKLDLTDLENGSLEAKLHVTTYYKVKSPKTVTILGQSFKINNWKRKSESVTFTKVFDAPRVFPVVNYSDINASVVYYNNSYNPHTTITIEPKNSTQEVITSVTYNINSEIATEYRLMGEVKTLDNGFKITNFENSQTFKGSNNTSYIYHGCYYKGFFDKSQLSVTVKTPFNEFQITNFNYSEVGDPTKTGINKPLAVALVYILLSVRTLIGMFQDGGIRRWR